MILGNACLHPKMYVILFSLTLEQFVDISYLHAGRRDPR